jgi:hypothetical protein
VFSTPPPDHEPAMGAKGETIAASVVRPGTGFPSIWSAPLHWTRFRWLHDRS